jgi:SAM-dependent methyltransferase
LSARADRQARFAKVYDEEILPAYAARFASLLLRLADLPALGPRARIVELACATGHLTRELGRRIGPDGQVTAIEEAPELIVEARAKIEDDPEARAPITFQTGSPLAPALDGGIADLVVSNLAVADAEDPVAAAREMTRLLVPGGRAVFTAPLRGTWAEFLDLFRDVLRESGKRESLKALDRYVGELPDGDAVARWLEDAGLVDVRVEIERWEILFKSAREFFFAPLVELGPLSTWKQLSGRGDEMQDVFFFTKEAIDTYFKGRIFAVTVLGAVVSGKKR